mmetsp:Transcript_7026/g.10394  ORF Transcript_7026/g.10394 Transcript_7026/m.10394 type:complete len:174 (-) Transcript_7026:607-1128(-)
MDDDGCCGLGGGGGGKWEKVVYWTNLLVAILLIVAGIVSIIAFFITIVAALSNPLSFAIFCYSIICGVLLFFGTIGKPEKLLNSFGFLKGPRLRAIFEFFMGTLCITAGFSGGVSGISNIFLLIAGFPSVCVSPFTFFYGKDHEIDDIDDTDYLAGGGVGGGGGQSRATASVI